MRNVSLKRAKRETYAFYFRQLSDFFPEMQLIFLHERMCSVFVNDRRKDKQKGFSENIRAKKEYRRIKWNY